LENEESEDDKVSGRMWEAVETKGGKTRVIKAEIRRKVTGRRREKRREEKEKAKEEKKKKKSKENKMMYVKKVVEE